jgi:hypothetical protein
MVLVFKCLSICLQTMAGPQVKHISRGTILFVNNNISIYTHTFICCIIMDMHSCLYVIYMYACMYEYISIYYITWFCLPMLIEH